MANEDTGASNVKGAQTLMRALDILDHVIEGPVRASDLARKLDFSKTTAHRLVQALRSRDYLTITPEGYSLGPKLLQLGVRATEQIDYVRVARPHIEALSDRTGFCVFVGKREGNWSRHLDRATGRQRLRVATAAGDQRPVAETGLGKSLLIDEDEATWEKLYSEATKERFSKAKLEKFLARMREAKRLGYVFHESELDDGVRSIACPVRSANGKIAIAISIASAAHYLTDDIIPVLAPQVVQTAADISALVGFKS